MKKSIANILRCIADGLDPIKFETAALKEYTAEPIAVNVTCNLDKEFLESRLEDLKKELITRADANMARACAARVGA